MSCCGGRRIAAWAPPMPDLRPDGAPAPPPPPVRYAYTGRTGLSMRGAITGRTYRFGAPGAVVEVDARDAPGAAGVPNLRRVRAEE